MLWYNLPMNYRLSAHAQDVINHRGIALQWIETVLSSPSLTVEKCGSEVHYFGTIEAYGNRCLKVVVNPVKRLVITVYFDRQMRKKGCK